MNKVETSLGASAIASLTAIARFHGLDVSEQQIAHLAAGRQSIGGSEIVQLARKIGLSAKLVRMPWKRLNRLGNALPALITLSGGNTVILSGVKPTETGFEVVVRSPAASQAGFQFLNQATLEASWDGQIVLLKRRYALTDATQPFSLRWFFPEMLRQRRALWDVVIAALTLHVLALATPIYIQLMIDRVILHKLQATMTVLTIGIAVAILFEIVLTYLRGYIILYATSKMDMRLTSQIFSKLLSLPLEFFERNVSGVISKHVQQDQKIREFLTGRLMLALLDGTALLVFVPVLLFYSATLTAIVVGCALVMAALIAALASPFRRRLTALYQAEGERQGLLIQAIHGISTIKALGLEPLQSRDWDRRAADAVERRIGVGHVSAIVRALSAGIEKVMLVTIIFVGVYLIFAGSLSVGALVAIQVLAMRVTNPLVQISALISEFQEVALSVQMLGHVMNAPSEPGMMRGLRPTLQGTISFDHVTFQYSGTSVPALDDVTFDLQHGKVLGVVGRSGSGKSTLVRLIQGLYPAQRGLIRIDGHEIRELEKSGLRRQIGVVLQESFLFRGTVRENIGIGKPGADFAEIVWAARQAGAEEFIERLPQGYDTLLEESGTNLSGGQRQRLAIARALVRQPRILILDEATSALDAESEMIIQDNMAQIVHNRTVILVSHRISLLRNADTILVMENGKIVGNNKHDRLLDDCHTYRQLWEKQSRSYR